MVVKMNLRMIVMTMMTPMKLLDGVYYKFALRRSR